MSDDSIANWAAIFSMIAAITASIMATQLAADANDISLLTERRRIYDDLWECLLTITSGTEPLPQEMFERLNNLDRTSEMVFPPKAYKYISSLIREAEAYAKHPSRDAVTPGYKRLSARAAVLNANLRPWINPYLRHERRR